ncbi:SAM-dependent DNA methyltransferase [Candidatus Parcubacteria bacterium]|nr:SAM-dependent DNA methyltransferase [Candidatus Parcubacteria bacterium]
MSNKKTRRKAEFGDFQTPPLLAKKVCLLLKGLGCTPHAVLEPTCGEGNFLIAALENFDSLTDGLGFDINPDYINILVEKLREYHLAKTYQSDFFDTDWNQFLNKLPDPLLVIGNPPWITNSELASLGSNNLPQKNNFQNHSGIEAITGASNFDISEWMLIKVFEWVRNRNATIAMLCKTTVARKVLLHEWKNNSNSGKARIFLIDALADFGASVDACLLVYDSSDRGVAKTCEVFSELSTSSQITCFGYEKNQLIANVNFYKKWKHLQNSKDVNNFTWRSGIKHDCSKVMELKRVGDGYKNDLGELVDVEETFVYPMMKSSNVAKAFASPPSRFMLVTQKFIGQETNFIKTIAPKTWKYLSEHRKCFDRRKSSIYNNRPPFSIFGVGDYSFAPWKVAISGLYKKLHFVVIGPHEGKPVVLDDTCYFLACQSEEEAELIARLLNSEPANEFFSSFIFWDAKRPITAKILKKLNIMALAKVFLAREIIAEKSYREIFSKPEQLRLLEQRAVYGL